MAKTMYTDIAMQIWKANDAMRRCMDRVESLEDQGVCDSYVIDQLTKAQSYLAKALTIAQQTFKEGEKNVADAVDPRPTGNPARK